MKVPFVISVSFPLHGMFTQSPECSKRQGLVPVAVVSVVWDFVEVVDFESAFLSATFTVVVEPEFAASNAMGFAPTSPSRTGQSRILDIFIAELEGFNEMFEKKTT